MQQRLQGGIAKQWALELKEQERGSLSEHQSELKERGELEAEALGLGRGRCGAGRQSGPGAAAQAGCGLGGQCRAARAARSGSGDTWAIPGRYRRPLSCHAALPRCCGSARPASRGNPVDGIKASIVPRLPEPGFCGCCPTRVRPEPLYGSLRGDGSRVHTCRPARSCCLRELVPHLSVRNGSGYWRRSASPSQLYKVSRWNIDGFGPQSD